jgi:formamidopyrimidine-DNA glycosylase
MPELPEVETIARGLAKRVVGDVICSVWLGSKPEPFQSPALEMAAILESQRIAGVARVGKHIVFDLEPYPQAARHQGRKTKETKEKRTAKKVKKSNHGRDRRDGAQESTALRGAQWIVHLGMTGRVTVEAPGKEVEKHTHAILSLGSGRELRFVDPRRFGRLRVAHGFQAAGKEPLEVELEAFVALFRGRKTPIKSALLNQKLLSGVGNIYADESLFRSSIRPRRRASSLTGKELGQLWRAVREVLQEAIALGGSSISDYVNADGEEGFFQFQHRVYGRRGEPCLVCQSPVRRIVIAGRSSHYCPRCQK